MIGKMLIIWTKNQSNGHYNWWHKAHLFQQLWLTHVYVIHISSVKKGEQAYAEAPKTSLHQSQLAATVRRDKPDNHRFNATCCWILWHPPPPTNTFTMQDTSSRSLATCSLALPGVQWAYHLNKHNKQIDMHKCPHVHVDRRGRRQRISDYCPDKVVV